MGIANDASPLERKGFLDYAVNLVMVLTVLFMLIPVFCGIAGVVLILLQDESGLPLVLASMAAAACLYGKT
jgi:hypothetical protein